MEHKDTQSPKIIDRKEYQTPELTVWGSIEDLTAGAPAGPISDGAKMTFISGM